MKKYFYLKISNNPYYQFHICTAARLIKGLDSRDHIMPTLRKLLPWLPFRVNSCRRRNMPIPSSCCIITTLQDYNLSLMVTPCFPSNSSCRIYICTSHLSFASFPHKLLSHLFLASFHFLVSFELLSWFCYHSICLN